MNYKENEVEDLERIYTAIDVNVEPIQISYAVVKSITKNFAQVIGHGAFGVVYLGALQNGLVAVKKLFPSKGFSDTQFLKEVKCLQKVKHKNIVRFLGYCADTQRIVMEVGGKSTIAEVQQRLLCFEYVPNGSLDNYLQEKTLEYEWNTHYQIIKGICLGLHYLHELRIYHLDLKPANVLLGAQMEPKITDFGLSRCIDGNQSTVFTINLGYIAPELINERKISFKSDIFSLGIIMKRLLTGSNDIIPENWHELLNVDCQQTKRCIEIAQICTNHDPSKRPTICEIIYELNETETTVQKFPGVVSKPRRDLATTLYQVVERFRTLPAQTPGEYREPEQLPVERPKWKLALHSPPKLPIITCEMIEDANGNPLEVILVDTDTGEPSALPSVLQIELVPLLGNFPPDCGDTDDFQRGIIEDLEGKRPLLAGEYSLTMWDGRVTVNRLIFTDDSWKCGCMFRIGVRVVPNSYHGSRILEAMTEAFMVRDRHHYELHYNTHYKWQLAFQSQPRLPVYVGRKIRDVVGNPLEVVLVDIKTGSLSAPPMELDIQLVPLYVRSGGKELSIDEFHLAVIGPNEGEGPLLSGDVSLTMKDDGRVIVKQLQFTSAYSVHIGARVKSGSYNGPDRILEGMTKAFKVEYSQLKMNTKHFPPAIGDEVWRLINISWGGVFHKRLTQNNVRSVQDFLSMLAIRPDELRTIIGDGIEDSTWEQITLHARDCIIPIDKVYAYSKAHATIYVNSIFHLVKLEFGSAELPLQLDEAQRILAQQIIREAYEHRHSLQEVKLVWKLAFKSQPRLPIHAGSRIEDAAGNPLQIILVDTETGSPWALVMKLHIKLVPLVGDFLQHDDKESWSAEEFQAAVVKRHQENVPLLKGFGCLIMRDGHVTVNDLQFTDSSSWVRCRKVRIGACVVPGGSYDGSFRILEAMTEAFVVGDLYQKHYPPVLDDPVWRLEMMDKDGRLHKKLASNNVDTAQEFRRMLTIKPGELRAIVGNDMTLRMLKMTVDHAKTCSSGDKVYAYRGANGTIYLNSVFGLLFKIEIDGVECPLQQQLDKAQMMLVRQLILEAYEHRHNLQEVDAVMEIGDHATISIFWLLRDAQQYVLHAPVKLDSQVQPVVDDDEVPIPQDGNLGHQGPSQMDSSSAS